MYFQRSVAAKNTGGILIDVKREAKGVFFIKWGTYVPVNCSF